MKVEKILLIFKTHLDMGYTKMAAEVLADYMNLMLPAAVQTAKELREAGGEQRLVWTTGSWLIAEYLRTQSPEKVQAMKEAIQAGDIRWHGIPFTMHTDFMSAELFEYGLSISQKLDAAFGKKTISAKMTDVPGHSKALITSLCKAGIEFLHIGVNPASMPADVPDIFRWQCDSGETINVMYQGAYGDFSLIGDSGVAMYFAHTNDNLGCQSKEEILALYAKLHAEYPDAQIVAADLNDLAMAVRDIEDTLPVITDEIGDTWIHGPASDPKLIAQYRALERLFITLPDGEDRDALAQGLLMIPEHTWGLAGSTNLKDYAWFERKVFEEKRKTEPSFARMEASWQEMRDYLPKAVERLSPDVKRAAERALAETVRKPAETCGGHTLALPELSAGDLALSEKVQLGGFSLAFNRQGEIVWLEKDGRRMADAKHRLMTLVYEQFGDEDFKRFYLDYIRYDGYAPFTMGALDDFTKIGMHRGVDGYRCYEPKTAEVVVFENRIVVKYHFAEEAVKLFGCPKLFDLVLTANGNDLCFDLAWFDKAANRMAEAIWVGFRPAAEEKTIRKFKQCIDPKKVVRNGQCRLHGTDFGVVYRDLSLETLDACLVSPQEPSILHFTNVKPQDEDPVHFNLFNNVWGTNFPQWFEGNARFRFVLHA